MLYRFFLRIKFFLTSRNQHGVHSPFVFDFVTKGLYQKKYDLEKVNSHVEFQNLSKKKKIILSKIINYFKTDSIYFDENNSTNTSDEIYKTLFINNIEKLLDFNFSILKSSFFIIVNDIYQNKETHLIWKTIIQKKEITVSIDLYFFGLIFFRKEQAKEHFKIRV